jgi:hypothetical protein
MLESLQHVLICKSHITNLEHLWLFLYHVFYLFLYARWKLLYNFEHCIFIHAKFFYPCIWSNSSKRNLDNQVLLLSFIKWLILGDKILKAQNIRYSCNVTKIRMYQDSRNCFELLMLSSIIKKSLKL